MTYLKLWRWIAWLDYLFGEESRGPEAQLLRQSDGVLDYVRAPYPEKSLLVGLVLLWPLVALWGVVMLVFWVMQIMVFAFFVTFLLAIAAIAWLFSLASSKK